jgi:co-chaperonin GroES (HSP10)|tara:strand:+ start:582 stop:899 length:318 start_codon:yes stop_codon:yes gene_type:complete
MNIKKLLGPRLVIRMKDLKQDQTQDGVFIPQAAVDEIQMYDEGEVIMCGTGDIVGGDSITFSVEVGDKVLVSRLAPKCELKLEIIDGIRYVDYLLNDGEISAILE